MPGRRTRSAEGFVGLKAVPPDAETSPGGTAFN
jgi:hypothetical protein